jgi:hypothetical protein
MTTIPTMAPTATELAETVLTEVDRLFRLLEGQVLVSQNRWVDHLLDLYNIACNVDLRREITESLNEIRNASSVRASQLRDELLRLAGAVAVESAFDDLLLPCPARVVR